MELPTHCYSCGVYLMGGATKHKPDCEVLRLIEESCRVVRLIEDEGGLPRQGRELKVSELRPRMMVWLVQACRNEAGKLRAQLATVRVVEVGDADVHFHVGGGVGQTRRYSRNGAAQI